MSRILAVSFLLLIFISNGHAAAGGGSSPFIPIKPAIVVNVQDGKRVRHMQVEIQLQAANINIVPKIDTHKAIVRHELIMLLSGQDMAKVSSLKGKEKLRKDALKSLQRALKKHIKGPTIEQIYFTNFIIQ